jgi:hypothetical protein
MGLWPRLLVKSKGHRTPPGRALLLALLIAAGCAHPREERAGALSKLIGADEPAVIRALGAPDLALDTPPLRTLFYNRVIVERGRVYRALPTATFPCRITITLEDGRVRSFDQQGGGC